MTGCWHWTGYRRDEHGGIVFWKGKKRLVRRVAWDALIAPLADGIRLLSRCASECCNPQHLSPNVKDPASGSLRTCKTCNQPKPDEVFRSKTGRRTPYCADCRREAGARTRAAFPLKVVKYRADAAERLRVKRQAALGAPSRCEICGVAFVGTTLPSCACFDHNHATGAARGWLCVTCNSAIGLLGDNPRILDAAAAYLRSKGHAATRPVIK
jgi:hypothetical protein